jgi:penicillin-binding protein 1A
LKHKKNKAQQSSASGTSPVKGALKWVGLVLGTLVLIGATTGAILCCYAAAYVQDVISPQVASSNVQLVASSTDLSSVIYYYDDQKQSYEELQTLYASENRVWVSYEDIPENLVNATIAIEDKRFRSHGGVDWKRTAAAALYMLTGQRVEGGSTITQQLIKNLTQQDQVTVRRKILEIFEALEFDKTHTKDEIMEWYLNEIYLGRGCYGVKTAARKYFGKELSDLSLAECASLISITNNPSLYDPYSHPENNLKRRTLVLEEMCNQGYIDEATRDAAQAEEINFTSGDSSDESGTSSGQYYSWYTDAVIKEVITNLMDEYDYDEKTASQMVYSGGLKIYSCLDPDIQKDVDEVYTTSSMMNDYPSANGDPLQSAITVVDNETGAVIAIAGGLGEKVGNRIWNRATDTVRQPGSSIKPLGAYSQAIEYEGVLPNTIVSDTAFTTVNGRSWPKNSHGGYSGNVDVSYAVEQSLNTVAVKVLDMVGTQNSYNFLTEKFHLSSLVDNYVASTGREYSDVGYSQLALGGMTKGVSTYEMAGAYSTFTRDGVFITPHLYTVVVDSTGKTLLSTKGYEATLDEQGNVTITGQPEGETILSTATCFYMTDMLQTVVTQGTGTSAAIDGMSVAGKTGTTDDDYDRWFVGYTPYYTAAVWTGYDRSSRITSGFNPATVLWQEVMSKASEGLEDIGFGNDQSYTTVTYCTKCGGIATSKTKSERTARFLVGDEPSYTDKCSGAGGSSQSNKKEETSTEPETTPDETEETPSDADTTEPSTPSESTTTPSQTPSEPDVTTPDEPDTPSDNDNTTSKPSEPDTTTPDEPETPSDPEPTTEE